ncbi:MAG: PaREP1 family protein [Nitrososphaerales archaeon]
MAERYFNLHRKYLEKADALILKGDYVQASEKLWGAVAEIVKAVGALRGVELKTHADLFQYVAKLREELKDPELSKLFHVANSLHQNFYEGNQPPSFVIDGAGAIKQLAAKLEKLTR